MNRQVLMGLLASSLILIGASGYMVWSRIQLSLHPASAGTLTQPSETPEKQPLQPMEPEPEMNEETEPVRKPVVPKLAPKKETVPETGKPRKITFQYHDSVPKRVSIVGDFNRWSPQLMKKNHQGNWSFTAELKPGEYANNFIVDGRMIRDPSNRKSKKAGQKIASSLLSVKAKK